MTATARIVITTPSETSSRHVDDLEEQHLHADPDEDEGQAEFEVDEAVHEVGEQEVHGAQAEDREGVRREHDERLLRDREDRGDRVDREHDVGDLDDHEHEQQRRREQLAGTAYEELLAVVLVGHRHEALEGAHRAAARGRWLSRVRAIRQPV